jgi:hypothetical protein
MSQQDIVYKPIFELEAFAERLRGLARETAAQ